MLNTSNITKLIAAQEKYLMEATTPEDWIQRSLEVIVPRGRKSALAGLWLKDRKFTSADLKHARNRHPYWKQIKQNGYKERNKKRWSKFNFLTKKQKWSEDKIKRFLKVHSLYVDRELAEMFETTIPGIQHWRRKLKLVDRIKCQDPSRRYTLRTVVFLMSMAEYKLRELVTKEVL